MKIASFYKDEKRSSFQFGIIKCQNKRNFQQLLIVQERCHTSMETSRFSNALKTCANAIDSTQEKDEKSQGGTENDYLENFVLV